MAKSYCTWICIKSRKKYCVLCVKNIARLHKRIHVMTIWDMRNHFNLQAIITVWWGLSPSRYILSCLQSYIKHLIFFLLFIFLCIFFFLSKSYVGIWEIEKKYPMMLSIWHSNFAMPKHTNIISWLAGNSGEMVIYPFLLGFSSHSRQKEWYEC